MIKPPRDATRVPRFTPVRLRVPAIFHLPSSILVFTLLLLLPALAQAATLSLPLGPYYRPGRYIPVRVTAAVDRPAELRLAADGAVPARARVDGNIDAVLPLLVVDGRAKNLRLSLAEESVDGPELQRLPDADRLVAWTTPDEPFARQLTGAARVIPVTLDPTQLLGGHPAAWEALDAVILDAAAARRLTEPQLAGLLAAGVSVAVKTDSPPHAAWPWRRSGDYAVLSFRPTGPNTGAGYHEAAYLPVADWQAGWPEPFRRRVLLVAGMFSIAFLGLALWRPRRAPAWAAVLVVAAGVVLHRWGSRQLGFRQAGGEVVVIGDALTQTDGWTYQTTPVERAATLRWADTTRPIFASRAGLQDLHVTLDCDPAGAPASFDVRLPPNRKLAFLTRAVSPRAPRATPRQPAASPLRGLVEALYLPAGGRLAGELPASVVPEPPDGFSEVRQWNPVVVDLRAR